jgi:hypothetical protein
MYKEAPVTGLFPNSNFEYSVFSLLRLCLLMKNVFPAVFTVLLQIQLFRCILLVLRCRIILVLTTGAL